MIEREIFEQARRILDPLERDRYLDIACGTDASLRARVERLVREAAERSTDPPPTVSASPPNLPQSVDDPLIGSVVGGVKLVRVINEGGMGRVYEGRQESPRRTVAVKVVKPGVATEKMLKRFEFEAQVLARLRHPGIAEIFYAGTFGEGAAMRPFFVMEYIACAKTLTQYAADLKLSTHDRLDLFRKVCEAVAHGHMSGVIHRDLKPSNILVDASGQPKVIDFGVAKTTDSDMALTTLQTDVGALIGTYQYMSPEQFDADPHGIDVRSDVYALGVVLYELLAGQPPYDLKRRILPEIASIVRQQDPTPLTNVNKTLRRDVGIIAGKCLEKDRNRRYSSASEVAADVGRYLVGDPIAAVAPGFWDGVVRLARRHRAAAAAVAGIAASLVAAVAGISVFAWRAEWARVAEAEQRAVATREREAADRERDVSTQAQVAAVAEATKAQRQLYVANLWRLQAALDRPERRVAKEIFRETAASYRAGYGDSAGEPIELRLLRPVLDRATHVLEAPGGVRCLAFSPDGSRLATGHSESQDSTIGLWNAETGAEVAVFREHEGPGAVECLAFSPDGSRLATAGGWPTAVRLWDAATGKKVAVLEGHGNWVHAIAFSPDGTRLATGSTDTTAILWDVATGRKLAVLGGHGGLVKAVAFSPDGTRLATGSMDNTAMLWDVATGKTLAVLDGAHSGVYSVAFSRDGIRLVTGSHDGKTRLWDTGTGRELAVFEGHDAAVESVAFSPDGGRLATASRDNTARLWDVATGDELAVLEGHEHWVHCLAFSPDGSRLATGSSDKTARLWDTATPQDAGVICRPSAAIPSFAFSPDGRRLATGSDDATAGLWDVATGTRLAALEGHEGHVSCLAFSPDGSRLATGSFDGSTRVWDTTTGQGGVVLEGHTASVLAVAFSPSGTLLATGSEDQTARLWDVAEGKERNRFEGHADRVSAVAFNPDGTTLATGAFDARARLWDVATGGTLAILEEQAFKSVAISPDGTRLATGSIAGASLWDVATGERLARLVGHEGIVACVGFSPDGTRLATGSSDTTVRLWDTATGKELVVLRGHEGTVESVAFIRDGAGLATASWDGTIRLWGLSNAEMNRTRRAAAERRERLGPTVDGWFAGDLDDVKAKLAAAKETMPPEDWHEAGNLVLMRAHARRHAIDATGDPARASGQRNAATPSLGGPTANPASGPTATETAPSRGNPASSGNDPGAPAAVAVPE